MKNLMKLTIVIAACLGFAMASQSASWQPLDTGSAAIYGANYVAEFTAADLTTTTTNSAQVFTNTVIIPSNVACRLRFAQVIKQAVGPTNWTYSLTAMIGDSALSNRYLSASECASASGPDWLQYPLPTAQYGTPSATNGLVLPSVVTNIAMPERDMSANTGIIFLFRPNAENSVSQASGLVYRAYFWLSPRGR